MFNMINLDRQRQIRISRSLAIDPLDFLNKIRAAAGLVYGFI
jgi:hypothetical protein